MGKLERLSIVAKNKHTESLQGPRIRISGFTREPVFPKTSKELVDLNKTAMLHPLKELVLRIVELYIEF